MQTTGTAGGYDFCDALARERPSLEQEGLKGFERGKFLSALNPAPNGTQRPFSPPIFSGKAEKMGPPEASRQWNQKTPEAFAFHRFYLAESSAVRYDRQIKFRQKPLRVKGVSS